MNLQGHSSQNLTSRCRVFQGEPGCPGDTAENPSDAVPREFGPRIPEFVRENTRKNSRIASDEAKNGTERKHVFRAVATPLCAAWQPPYACGAGGRYRPICPAEFLAPSPAELQEMWPTEFKQYEQRR